MGALKKKGGKFTYSANEEDWPSNRVAKYKKGCSLSKKKRISEPSPCTKIAGERVMILRNMSENIIDVNGGDGREKGGLLSGESRTGKRTCYSKLRRKGTYWEKDGKLKRQKGKPAHLKLSFMGKKRSSVTRNRTVGGWETMKRKPLRPFSRKKSAQTHV